MSSTRVDVEEIETTRSEKLLATVLAVFILIGLLWAYFELDEIAPPDRFRSPAAALEADDRAALDAHRKAQRDLNGQRRSEEHAEEELALRREAYRTALDAGREAPSLRADYLEARSRHARAEEAATAAQTRLAGTRPAAQEAREQLSAAGRELFREVEDSEDRHDRIVLALRLILVVAMATAGYWLLSRLRAQRSRYLPVAFASIGATAVLALVMAVDYTTDFIDVTDLGPLVLSLAGSGMTLAAFVGLQRYLARRTPLRRVRKQQCPFCGFPTPGKEHCEGCGRRLLGECSTCHGPRRVGAPHCASCGST